MNADKETLIRVHLRSSAASDFEYLLHLLLALQPRIASADGPEGGPGRLRVRNSKIRVVQNVEELRPELHPGLISNPEVLVHGKIPLVEVGSAERIAADIPVRRAGRRRGECVTGEIGVQHRRAALAGRAAADVGAQERLAAIVVGER